MLESLLKGVQNNLRRGPLPKLTDQKKIALILGTIKNLIIDYDKRIETSVSLNAALMQKLFTEGTKGEELKVTSIGTVPKSWNVFKVSEIVEKFVGGGTPSTEKEEFWNGNIPWTTTALMSKDKLYLYEGQKNITEKGLASSSSHVVPANNLLVATRVGVGKVAINKVDMAINQDITGLVFRAEINRLFMAYCLRSERCQRVFTQGKRGSTIKGITRNDLEAMSVALPEDIKEQQLIVDLLVEMEQRIFLEQKKRDLYQELFDAMLDKLMAGEISVKDIEIN